MEEATFKSLHKLLSAGVIKMDSLHTILLVVAALFTLLSLLLVKGENYVAPKYRVPFRKASPQEAAALGVPAWGCIYKWTGTPGFTGNIPTCKLPEKITNQGMLNYQLAGRVCDLQYMHDTLGCKTPGVEDSPYDFDVSRGYFRLF